MLRRAISSVASHYIAFSPSDFGPCLVLDGGRIFPLMGMTIENLQALGLSDRAWMRLMPPILGDIARIIGVEKTLRLALHYGGEGIYIPVRMTSESGLGSVIGIEATRKLSQQYKPGETVLIPSTFHAHAHRRFIAIAMLEKGATIKQVCQTVGIARSTAYEWQRIFADLNAVSDAKERRKVSAPGSLSPNNEFEAVLKPAESLPDPSTTMEPSA